MANDRDPRSSGRAPGPTDVIGRDVPQEGPLGLDGPADILALEQDLLAVQTAVRSYRAVSEELLFGSIGLDALIGLIPVAGGIYSIVGGVWLHAQAQKAHCPAKVKRFIRLVCSVDVVIGVVPGLGDAADVVFRAHAWSAGRILKDVEARLAVIENTRAEGWPRAPEHQALLRRRLFPDL